MTPKKTPTEKQQAVSRANERLSHGPVTERGRANSHLASAILLDTETRAQFDAPVADLNIALNPEPELNHSSFVKMAAPHWRQIHLEPRKGRHLETADCKCVSTAG